MDADICVNDGNYIPLIKCVKEKINCNKMPEKEKRDSSMPDGHGYELVSSVRALVPQKFSVEEEQMHVKHVEVKSPHVGVMWNFGRGVISSDIVLVT
ncbi:hypothetical protein TNCV_1348071 [Trichonephila clavipes]|nr:hypothetical protein TNCV_1348071 [Trichonephila clavipes]